MAAPLWLEIETVRAEPTDEALATYYARTAPPGAPALAGIRDHVARAFIEEARRLRDETARFQATLAEVQGAGGLVIVSRLLDDGAGTLGELTLRKAMRPLASLVTDERDRFFEAQVSKTTVRTVIGEVTAAKARVTAPDVQRLPDSYYTQTRSQVSVFDGLLKELKAIDDALAIAVAASLKIRLARRATPGARRSEPPRNFGRVIQKAFGASDAAWVRIGGTVASFQEMADGWLLLEAVIAAPSGQSTAPGGVANGQALIALRAGKRNPGGLAWGQAMFAPRDRASAERIMRAFAAGYGLDAPLVAKDSRPVTIALTDFGPNFVAAPDGSLVERNDGTWRATEWKIEFEGGTTELYFNVDIEARKFEFKEKDHERRKSTLLWLSKYAPQG